MTIVHLVLHCAESLASTVRLEEEIDVRIVK